MQSFVSHIFDGHWPLSCFLVYTHTHTHIHINRSIGIDIYIATYIHIYIDICALLIFFLFPNEPLSFLIVHF